MRILEVSHQQETTDMLLLLPMMPGVLQLARMLFYSFINRSDIDIWLNREVI